MHLKARHRKVLCSTLLAVLACKPTEPTTSQDKNTENLSLESLQNLKIKSTLPQEWELTISTGQKTPRRLLAREIVWSSPLWNMKSPLASSTGQDIVSLSIPTIHGTLVTQPIAFTAKNTLFHTHLAHLKGEELHLFHQQKHWQLTAKHYQSTYPWSQLKLYEVKGEFSR